MPLKNTIWNTPENTVPVPYTVTHRQIIYRSAHILATSEVDAHRQAQQLWTSTPEAFGESYQGEDYFVTADDIDLTGNDV